MVGDDDLTEIFESGDFNQDAIFTISTGPTVTLTVQAIFTGATDETVMFGSVAIEASKPSLIVKSDDLVTTGKIVKPKMAVNVNSTNYTVERIEKSGVGLSTVYLKTT